MDLVALSPRSLPMPAASPRLKLATLPAQFAMREPILVINAGSSSCKFSVYETAADRSLSAGVHGQVSGIGEGDDRPRIEVVDGAGRKLTDRPIAAVDHARRFAGVGVGHTDGRESYDRATYETIARRPAL